MRENYTFARLDEIGRIYTERKKSHRSSGETGRTGWILGRELGVNHDTITRAEKISMGIDAIRLLNPELADGILAETVKAKRQDIIAIGEARPEDRRHAAELFCAGRVADIPVETRKRTEAEIERKEEKNRIREAMAGMTGQTSGDRNVNQLIRDLTMNTEPFIRFLRRLTEDERALCSANRYAVIRAIDEHVILKIREIEEEIEQWI